MVKASKAAEGKIRQLLVSGTKQLFSDEPPEVGEDLGFAPHDLLDAALASCTAMTITLVARRKQWPLKDVKVEIVREATDTEYRMNRTIELVGELSEEQRQYLLGIANKCPVHRTLHKKIEIPTTLLP